MSSDVQPSVSRMPRQADLNCLPTEIKTHIARLCAQQDDRLREQCDELSRRYEPSRASIRGSIMRPSSIGCLFRASKEWSTIAAPFRFTVLSMRLLRREDFYHETFHTLNFEARSYEHRTSMDILVKLAGVLPLLPNLRTVKLVDFNAIFSHAESAEIPAFSKVCKLMGQATTLTLGTESSAISSEAVCSDLQEIGHFPNLTSLHLNVQSRVLPDMAEALKCMSNLLSLDLVLRGEDETADEACEIAAACLRDEYGFAPNEINPALRHLSFDFYDSSTSVIDLVSTFRASLVHLDLCARKNVLDPDDTGTLADDFPELETLTVRGDVRAFTSLLKSLEPDDFPRLGEIRYLPPKYPQVGGPSAAPVRVAPDFN
ncbi:hypothetical protein BMF94_3351 [Rhodotorula taiwanensis]|uniref:F-box domain-containing protein n=1 Tax=Rhodotorula taiwanensis TaxID=741276 RepID=A0A2S5BAK7_9BASI|nr:hypothetical protein BMF94_3351 [Rhodotorula taiwanensis]